MRQTFLIEALASVLQADPGRPVLLWCTICCTAHHDGPCFDKEVFERSYRRCCDQVDRRLRRDQEEGHVQAK